MKPGLKDNFACHCGFDDGVRVWVCLPCRAREAANTVDKGWRWVFRGAEGGK